jgi:hypothetical protein
MLLIAGKDPSTVNPVLRSILTMRAEAREEEEAQGRGIYVERRRYDRIDDLPNSNAQYREVCARYGCAMYHADLFENELRTLLHLSEGVVHGRWCANGSLSAAQLKELLTQRPGIVLKRLGASGFLSALDLKVLRDAIRARNHLAHSYWSKHGEDFVTTAGLQRMIDAADDARRIFRLAQQFCEDAIFREGQRIGVTRERMTTEAERRVAELREQADALERSRAPRARGPES